MCENIFKIIVRGSIHKVSYKAIKKNHELINSDTKIAEFLNLSPEKYISIDAYVKSLCAGEVGYFNLSTGNIRLVLKFRKKAKVLEQIQEFCKENNFPYTLVHPNKFLAKSKDVFDLAKEFCIINHIRFTESCLEV